VEVKLAFIWDGVAVERWGWLTDEVHLTQSIERFSNPLLGSASPSLWQADSSADLASRYVSVPN
jgi:hypothetical protein